MTPSLRRTLRALARSRSRTELKALFAAIRAHDDAALLDIAAPAARTKTGARPTGDLAQRVAATLAPIVARADEKAQLLADTLAELQHAPALDNVRGLAPTVRKLAALHGDKAVLAAADAVMERLRSWGSTRERVK